MNLAALALQETTFQCRKAEKQHSRYPCQPSPQHRTPDTCLLSVCGLVMRKRKEPQSSRTTLRCALFTPPLGWKERKATAKDVLRLSTTESRANTGSS